MTTTVAPKASDMPINGRPYERVAVEDPVLRAEYEFVLRAFDELKLQGDAELRISVTKDRASGEVEIIYAGIHQKRALESLRQVYRARDRVKGVVRR